MRTPALLASLALLLCCQLPAAAQGSGLTVKARPLLDPQPSGKLELHVIDLKIHGEALLLRTPHGKVILMDAGRRESQQRVIDTLQALGVRTIDLVLLSHSHPDHFGGMPAVANNFAVRRFWRPDVPEKKRIRKRLRKLGRWLKGPTGRSTRIEAVSRGKRTRIDGVTIEVLGPTRPFVRGAKSRLNANGLLVRVSYGASRWLLTGDIEKETEAKLLRENVDVRCQLLKVAHHGSKTSSTPAFLRATGARVAVISSNPPYKHPHGLTVKNLRRARISWYRTDRNHHILVTTPGDGSYRVRKESGRVNDATRPKTGGLKGRLKHAGRWLKGKFKH